MTGIAAILRFPLPDIEDILSDSDEESDNETNIVNGHICNNMEPEVDEPKAKTQKTTTPPKKEPTEVNPATSSEAVTEKPKKEVKKSSAIAAPKGSTQKKNRFVTKKYEDDDYGNGYDDYGYEDDFL